MNNNLFEKNIDLVEKIVNKMNYGYIDKDDLYQAGLIGLYKAIQKYDYSKNDNFKSFCSVYIISEIKNELRNNKLIKLNKNIIKIKRYLKNNETLSFGQISKDLNVSIELVYLASIYKDEIYSLNQKVDEEEIINSIEDNTNYNKNYIDIINRLDEFSKFIIVLKYYKNYTQFEISKLLKCSQSKVSRVEKKALDYIKKQLL